MPTLSPFASPMFRRIKVFIHSSERIEGLAERQDKDSILLEKLAILDGGGRGAALKCDLKNYLPAPLRSH